MNKRALVLASSCALVLAAGPAFADSPPIDAPSFAGLDAVGDIVAGEVVVDLIDDLDDEGVASLARDLHLTLRDNSPDVKHDGNVAIVDVGAENVADVIARLSADGRVEAAEPLGVARAFFTPNDPKFSEQWHMSRVHAERGWDYACGQGVTVAVVDTGIACYDEKGFMKGTDLTGTSCVEGHNFVGKNALAADDQGHGTHVAGTIAQTTNNGVGVAGLAHCAKLMPVKVLSRQGWGTMADVAEGIRWAADHGAQVINLSLGSPMKSKTVENAVIYAHKKGAIVVAAAGNSGKAVGYPAAYADAIAVSATDRNDAIAWFSSRGPQVAIGAPGVAVTQQTICEAGKNKCEQWGVFNGTSMAAPHVAGAAALLVGQGITEPGHVRDALRATAAPKDDANLFGAGILDAGAAVARTHWSHVGVRLAALFVLAMYVARRIRRKGGSLAARKGTWIAATFASIGLLPFLPLVGVPALLGEYRWIAELAMKPFGEWDLLFSPGLHKWLLLASALPAFALTTLFFGSKRLRGWVGGFALGTAALLVQLGISGETLFALGPFALRVFAVVNVLACLWIANLSLKSSTSR